jgi:hypothetical protein
MVGLNNNFGNGASPISSRRITRARDRTELAVHWLAGNATLAPSIGLAERIFQTPRSRIRPAALAAGYSSNGKRKRKSLAEAWRAASAAERAEFLRVCGADLSEGEQSKRA